MVRYLLLLCLLAFGPFSGQAQVSKECYNCRMRLFSTCFFTTSYTAQCQDNSNCGITNYTFGNFYFTSSGCIEQSVCNQSLQGGGVMKGIFTNTTCCITSFCNGGFTARAPHLAILGPLSLLLLYVIS